MIAQLCLCCAAAPLAAVDGPDPGAVPPELRLDGFVLSMHAFVWRDFMPISPPDGRPLSAVLEIQVAGLPRYPAYLVADRVWIIQGRDVWSTQEIKEQPVETADRLRLFVAGGPRWPAGSPVTVILRLVDQRSGEEALLRTEQIIQRTD